MPSVIVGSGNVNPRRRGDGETTGDRYSKYGTIAGACLQIPLSRRGDASLVTVRYHDRRVVAGERSDA